MVESGIPYSNSSDDASPRSSVKLPNISRFANHKDPLSNTLQKNLASSVIRSNPGFMAELITTSDQYVSSQQGLGGS